MGLIKKSCCVTGKITWNVNKKSVHINYYAFRTSNVNNITIYSPKKVSGWISEFSIKTLNYWNISANAFKKIKGKASITFYIQLKYLSSRIATDKSSEIKRSKRIFFLIPSQENYIRWTAKCEEMIGKLLQMEGKYSIYFYEYD